MHFLIPIKTSKDLPKSQSFTTLTSEDILRVENLLNTRPRKVLGFATPQETFDKLSSNMLSLGSQ